MFEVAEVMNTELYTLREDDSVHDARQLMAHQQEVFGALQIEMQGEGISLCNRDTLVDSDLAHLEDVFLRRVFPVLSPLGIDPSHPFPRLLNKSLNFIAWMTRLVS